MVVGNPAPHNHFACPFYASLTDWQSFGGCRQSASANCPFQYARPIAFSDSHAATDPATPSSLPQRNLDEIFD
jgi:hypothetical protein